jgi:undecaprenyl-diphosphatase
MSDFLDVTFLAILQGVAEFLPISSSGHLVIGQHVLGVKDAGLQLDVFLHVGTLLSVAMYYRKSLWRIVAERDFSYLAKIVLSALPAVAVYAIFKEEVESLFNNTKMVGALLMFTGAVLAGTRFLPTGTKGVSFLRALWMGCMQAMALLPGVSRSGMTLAAARSGKVEPSKSAEFSFLMSAPLILGGMFLEILKMFRAADDEETYYRYCEEFAEKAYDLDDIRKWLEDCKFEVTAVYEEMTKQSVTDKTQRAVFVARKHGTQ